MSTKSGLLIIVCVQFGRRELSVIRRGCLSIEVNGRTVGTFGIVRYIVHWVSAVEECPLSGVPLYMYLYSLYNCHVPF